MEKFMEQTPCEEMMWKVFPVIRKEIVCCMKKDFGLTQKEIAKKLGITPAAVSQYKCHKRAKIDIKNKNLLDEIYKTTEKILENGIVVVIPEICRICKIIRSLGLSSFH